MIADLSIIIVSYNQFSSTTGLCLQSLAAVQDTNLQIIVVDNGSDRETVRELKNAARKDSRISLLLHGENRGYAAANNDGVELAKAGYLLLLNSDTVVPADVPGRFVKQLQAEKTPCLLGPVTNSVGNEQQIYIRDNSTLSSVLAQGEQWSRHTRGSIIATDQLSFFCVAMARQTYQIMDGLDLSFGLGFYEDADFCCRAVASGISLYIQEECFIYHRGSASFSRMPDTVKKLLAVNRKLFRARHGRGEGAHVRWKNLQVLDSYRARMEENGIPLRYPAENRLAQARRLFPRNLLKKILYTYRLRRTANSIAQCLAACSEDPYGQ